MERELQQFCDIPHVGGAFVCDNRGEVILSSHPAVLATVAMNAIGREVGRSLLALEASGHGGLRLDYAFDSWTLFARELGEALVFVVCEAGVDVARVRMTMEVTMNAWQNDSRAQKRLAGWRVERKQLVIPPAIDQNGYLAWNFVQSENA
ncbi:MAG: hypothetical protein ABI782_02145 [Anaerolineaceae bacterium]